MGLGTFENSLRLILLAPRSESNNSKEFYLYTDVNGIRQFITVVRDVLCLQYGEPNEFSLFTIHPVVPHVSTNSNLLDLPNRELDEFIDPVSSRFLSLV